MINDSAFFGCVSLARITIDPEKENYKLYDGVVFNGTRLVKYPAAKEGTTYEIPSNVTEVQGYAFCECSKLISIRFRME